MPENPGKQGKDQHCQKKVAMGVIPWQPLFQVGPFRINDIPDTFYAWSAFFLLAGWESSILKASSFACSSAARDAVTRYSYKT